MLVRRNRRTIGLSRAAIAAVVATAGSGVCAGAARCEGIDKDLLRDDPRLEAPITLALDRTCVGDLLGEIGQRSGVVLRISNSDPEVGCIPLSVRLAGVTIYNALDGVWSALSYRDGDYRWVRDGERGAYTYTFGRSTRARRLAEDLENLVGLEFSRHADAMMSALDKSPAERDSLSKRDPTIGALLSSERLRSGLALFENSFSPTDRQSIISGAGPIRLPVDSLRPVDQEFVRRIFDASASQAVRREADGSVHPLPPPSYVQAYTRRVTDGQLAPVLFIAIEGIGGYGYLGGLPVERALQRRLDLRWIRPDENAHKEIESREVGITSTTRSRPDPKWQFESSLQRAGERFQTSFIARVPLVSRTPSSPDSASSLSAYLADLREAPQRMSSKWRGDLLLLTYHAWFHEDSRVPSFEQLIKLRQAHKDGGGLLPLAAFVELCGRQSRSQVESLAWEFPSLNNVRLFYALFRFCAQSPQAFAALQSDRGLPFVPSVAATLQSDVTSPIKLRFDPAAVSSVRVIQEDKGGEGDRYREITLGFINRDDKWNPVIGFVQRKRPGKESAGPSPQE